MRGRILVACGLCVLISACHFDPARSCTQDSDCAGNGYCDRSTNTCVASLCNCGLNESCEKSICEPVHSDVKLTASPEVDGGVGHVVQLTAQFQPASGSAHADPDAVALVVKEGGATSTVLLRALDAGVDGVYGGTWNPSDDGATYQLTVDAGFPNTAALSLRATFAGPVLTLSLPNLQVPTGIYADPAGAGTYPYRRDQTAQLEVAASEDVDPSSVHVFVAGTDGVMSEVGPLSAFAPCDAGLCADVPVDLSKPVMNAFRTVFPVQVQAENGLQNASAVDGGIGVTRWAWQVSLPGEIYGAPALGRNGAIFVGVRANSTTGALIALSVDGGILWEADGGAAAESPTVGKFDGGDLVYSAFATTAGVTLAAIDAADGGLLDSCADPGSTFFTSPALMNTNLNGTTLETAVIVSGSASGSNLVSIRPFATPVAALCPLFATVAGVAPQSGMNVVASGQVIAAPNSNFSRIDIVPFGATGWGAPTEYDAGTLVRTLSIYDGDYFGSSMLGGVVGTRIPSDGGDFVATPDLATSTSWGPTISGTGEANFSTSAGLVQVQPDGGLTRASLGTNETSIILGAGDWKYFALRGSVVATERDPTQEVWQLADAGFDQVLGAPALDCDRIAANSGILYVAAKNGTVTAIVVDSRGIDTSAPWPKYQHDPRNTGNANTDLSEFTCP